MKLDGVTPTGPQPEGAKGAKPAKGDGKAFGAAFKRAASALAPRANDAPAVPVPAPAASNPTGPTPAAASASPAVSGQPSGPAKAPKPANADATDGTTHADHMELIKFRMRTGYYSSKNVDDALSDKLTGYFDDLAS